MGEFDDLEAAFVHVEVDVPLLEIGRVRFPDAGLRKPPLNRLPGPMAKAAAFLPHRDEEEIERVMLRLRIDGDDGATHGAALMDDAQNDRPRRRDRRIKLLIGGDRAVRQRAQLRDNGDRESRLQVFFEGRIVGRFGDGEGHRVLCHAGILADGADKCSAFLSAAGGGWRITLPQQGHIMKYFILGRIR